MAQVKMKAIDYPEEDALNIYTDGPMLPGPRRGGIFILINDNGEEEEDAPYLAGYTGATKVVDKHAKLSAATATGRQLRPATVRRKRSHRELERGSVEMEGQRLTIRITKSEYQPLHKLTKYWYEVRSRKSPFHDRRDVNYACAGRLRPLFVRLSLCAISERR